MDILTQFHYRVNDQIPAFATPAEAQRDRNVRSIAARAVDGDLANWSLEAVAGLLLMGRGDVGGGAHLVGHYRPAAGGAGDAAGGAHGGDLGVSELIDTELAEIIEQVTTGQIDISEGARRLGILESEPDRYNCGTCAHFRRNVCYRPGQPPQPENAMSARCGAYVPQPDERDLALPAARPNGRCLFK